MQRTLVITGATSGLGKRALSFLSDHYHIILLARDENKAKQIIKENGQQMSGSITFIPCDLSSFQSIQEAIQTIYKKFSDIDTLVNNAACIPAQKIITPDGFEMQFQVNYLSHAYLTLELLPLINRGDGGRVIFTSSMVHRYQLWEFNEHHPEDDYQKETAYGKTKLAQVMLARYLSQAGPENVCFVSYHPGVLRTKLLSDYMGSNGSALSMGEDPLSGAKRLIFLINHTDLKSLNGSYFENNVPTKPAFQALDDNENKKLFDYTVELLQPYFNYFESSLINPDFQ